MVSVGIEVSLLREHRGHSPGPLISLSVVEDEDGWSWSTHTGVVVLILLSNGSVSCSMLNGIIFQTFVMASVQFLN